MLLIGHGLTAHFAALNLQNLGVPFLWWRGLDESKLGVTSLALLPAPTLSLAQHSRKLWQETQAKAPHIPLLHPMPFYDLATTAGHENALKQEALLGAVAGEETQFTETPKGLHPKLVRGVRVALAGPEVHPHALGALQQQVGALGFTPQEVPMPAEAEALRAILPSGRKVLVADETVAQRVGVITTPRRCHKITWALPAPLVLPQAPLCFLHRMPRGHAWGWLEAQSLTVIYDGIADPRQATAEASPDAPTVAALETHMRQVFMALKGVTLEAPLVKVVTDVYLPDTLPYAGPLQNHPDIILVGGAGARTALYAPALAEKGVEQILAEEFAMAPLAPNRMPLGAETPESLVFVQPEEAAVQTGSSPEKADRLATVKVTEAPEVQRMDEIRMVEKKIESGRSATVQEPAIKSKMQMASIKS